MSDSNTNKEISEESSPEAFPAFMLLHRNIWQRELLCIVGFLFVVFVWRFQAVVELNSSYLGGFERDAGLYVWLLKSNVRDFFSLPFFDTSAFYPYTRTLAWSDNFLLPSLFAAPFLYFELPVIITYNLILLLATFLNGYCCYRLCYRLTGNLIPAFCAGVAFLSLSYFTGQLGHPQLQFAFFLPLGLSTLFSALAYPTILRSLWPGLIVFLAFLTTVYYSIFLVVAYFALFIAIILLRPQQYSRQNYFTLFAGLFFGVFPLVFFVFPYLDIQAMFGKRGIYEAYYFSATALSYISSSAHNLVYGLSASLSHAEAYLLSGLVIPILAILAWLRLSGAKDLKKLGLFFIACFVVTVITSIFSRSHIAYAYLCMLFSWMSLISAACLIKKMGALERKLGFDIMTNRALIACFAFIALAFFLLSLGPLGNPEKGQYALSVFRPFYELLPGFSSMRAISRCGVVVLLCLCVSFSFGLAIVAQKTKWGMQICWALLVLVLIENYNLNYPRQTESHGSSVFDHLNNIEHESNVLMVIPFTRELKDNATVESWGDFAELNVNYMHWTFPLNMRIVNGYSGQRSKVMKEFPRKMRDFPDRRSLNTLGLIPDLRYIIYVSSAVSNFDQDTFMKQIVFYKEEIKFISSDESGNYLFEYIGTTPITDEFFLRVPSYPDGFLHLELQVAYEEMEPQYELKVFEQDHYNGQMVSVAKIKADGKWETYSFSLPKAVDRARPFRISFKIDKNAKILLGRRNFSYAESVVK